jgi:hypothetical protein
MRMRAGVRRTVDFAVQDGWGRQVDEAEIASDFTLCLPVRRVPDMADFASRTLSYGSAFQNVWIGSIGSIVRTSECVLHVLRTSYMQTASLVVQQLQARLMPRSVAHLHRSRPSHIHSQSGILITRRSCDVRDLSTCRLHCVK